MQHNPYSYTVEKLTNTIEVLATHPGDARERVASAFTCFMMLQERDFPPELLKKWKQVDAEFRRFPPVIGGNGQIVRGTVEVWSKKVRKTTGARVARLLYELYWAVSQNTQYV